MDRDMLRQKKWSLWNDITKIRICGIYAKTPYSGGSYFELGRQRKQRSR